MTTQTPTVRHYSEGSLEIIPTFNLEQHKVTFDVYYASIFLVSHLYFLSQDRTRIKVPTLHSFRLATLPETFTVLAEEANDFIASLRSMDALCE